MPVFVNEVVISGEIVGADRSGEGRGPGLVAATGATGAPIADAAHEDLVEEIASEVFRRLERALDRQMER